MKKNHFIAVLLTILTSSISLWGQNIQSNSIDLTYSPVTLKASGNGTSISASMDAFSANWAQTMSLTDTQPIFLQYGAGLQYAWGGDKETSYGTTFKNTISFLTAKIPVNVLYRLDIPNTEYAFVPYFGINLQGHILGQATYSYNNVSETTNYFSKDDMGEGRYNRFVVGWQIGARLTYQRYFLGIAYEGPITNLYKENNVKLNMSQINLSLGFSF